MQYEIKQVDKFRYLEEGEGEPLVLLHGLFGALSNFRDLIEYFRHHYKVVVPMLPLFDLDLLHTSVDGLEKFLHKFLENREKIKLLLFDLIMPKKTGKEAYDEIREIMPDIKVIFASGYAPETIQQKAMVNGNLIFTSKPFSPTDLLKKVRSALDEDRD